MRDYPVKPTPEKYCAACGAKLERKRFNNRLEDMSVFLRRQYCSRECSWTASRKESVTLSGLLKRATQLKDSACEVCQAQTHLGVHHKDRNPANNSSENLLTLCASCHTKLHWSEGKRPWKELEPCQICGAVGKLKHGMCQKHYQRWKKFGDPFLTKRLGGTGSIHKQPIKDEIEWMNYASSEMESFLRQLKKPSGS
ncbi:MAG: hypothetical protein A2Y38_20070 [Spirochaetes bacterium GWB1_59_5]|nr:MAG: hypothetical protein A2Y38_20070 [Spirochaetes bacterium GWB1_59_5]